MSSLSLIIPLFKTECGEHIHGSVELYNGIIHITLVYKGSQFLGYIANQIILIMHHRRCKYLFYLNKIFWRINKMKMQGRKIEMANEILFYMNQCLESQIVIYFNNSI